MRRVLLVPTVVVAGLAVAALATVASTSRSATREVEQRIGDVLRANTLALRLAHLTAVEEREVLGYRLEPTRSASERIAAADREIQAVADAIERLEISPRGRELWREVSAARAFRARQRGDLVAAVDRGDTAAIERAYARWDLATARTSALVADLSVFNLRQLERALADMERVRSRSVELLVGVLAASAVLVLAFSLLVDRHLVRPVQAMTAAARRIASERTAIAVPGGGRSDELGVLARAMTRMAGDLVRANTELERSVEARDEFLSISSHELKTPLTALKLQLQSGTRRWAEQHGPAPVPTWVTAALKQVERVEALVAELLDLARIRTGRLTLRMGPTDLAELARGVAARLGDVLVRSGNTLDADLAERIEVECDAERVEQVLANLLVNAAQHAPGSHVLLRAAQEGDRAILSVEDDGPGIPDDARERVFEPYEKGRRARHVTGLGLGLHIARQIAEAHGGRITVAAGPRGGARFVVELPARAARAAGGAPRAP